jgi:hypothetical protein
MELYYHVVNVNRKKKCEFNFCFIKLKKYVVGRVIVNVNDSGRVPHFDEKSDSSLDENEKKYIIDSVLKHI